MTEFTIDLISNASVQIHPQNYLGSFTNELLVPIELDREYECAIIELFHPTLVFNKQTKKSSFDILLNGSPMWEDIEFVYKQEDTLSDICDVLNKVVKSHEGVSKAIEDFGKTSKLNLPSVSLSEQPIDNRKIVTIYPGSVEYETLAGENMTARLNIVFKDHNFLRLLGFEPVDYLEESKDFSTMIRAKYYHDKHLTNNLMFIYCDIISEHHVGDVMANSLRVVALWKENEPRILGHTFIKPIYFPVRHQRISSVSVMLRDETGSSIAFDYGTVYLTLHFRPRRSSI